VSHTVSAEGRAADDGDESRGGTAATSELADEIEAEIHEIDSDLERHLRGADEAREAARRRLDDNPLHAPDSMAARMSFGPTALPRRRQHGPAAARVASSGEGAPLADEKSIGSADQLSDDARHGARGSPHSDISIDEVIHDLALADFDDLEPGDGDAF
jgi:hypothetical protein